MQFQTVASTPTLQPVVNVTFPPVTARFVRVQINGVAGLNAIVDDVSVRPQ